jgi:hypothetical protein
MNYIPITAFEITTMEYICCISEQQYKEEQKLKIELKEAVDEFIKAFK